MLHRRAGKPFPVLSLLNGDTVKLARQEDVG